MCSSSAKLALDKRVPEGGRSAAFIGLLITEFGIWVGSCRAKFASDTGEPSLET